MSKKEWRNVTCDLFHDTYVERDGLIVVLRPIMRRQHLNSTAVLIHNKNDGEVEIRFDWHKIPGQCKKKVHGLKPGQLKRFVVPSQRRVSILWKSTAE